MTMRNSEWWSTVQQQSIYTGTTRLSVVDKLRPISRDMARGFITPGEARFMVGELAGLGVSDLERVPSGDEEMPGLTGFGA